jgi:hypothetical protein
MGYVVVFFIMVIVVGFISWSWTEGIDYMKKNHPEYEGDDFLDWDRVTKSSGRDSWDDNKVHTDYEV